MNWIETACVPSALAFVAACASTASNPPMGNGTASTSSTIVTANSASSSATNQSSSGQVGNDSGSSGDANSECNDLPLCDGFESDTVGLPPSSSLWSLVGTAGCSGQGNPSAPTIYPIVVDDTQHNTGNNSVKVVGGDSCGPLMINTSAFSKLTGGNVYGRFYVHLSDTSMTFDHAVLMALGLLSDGGVGLNIGDQSSYLQLASEGAGNSTNVLMWQTTDGNILPDKNAAGGAESAYVSASGFTCIEFHTSASPAGIQTWINGNEVTGLTDPPLPANASQWVAPSPFAPTSFALGWVVFSGESLTAWFDDVALSTSRIGCL